MSSVRIVVAEEEPGVCTQLTFAPDLEIVGRGRDVTEVIATVGQFNPDILILGSDLPGVEGWEILQMVRWCSPNTRVIILSSRTDEATILDVLELGAMGYINKGDGTDMAKAIRAVHRGELWVRRKILARLLERYVGLTSMAY